MLQLVGMWALLLRNFGFNAGARKNSGVLLAVVGAHLRGQPVIINSLREKQNFPANTHVACTGFYALAGTQPRNGLRRVAENCARDEIENLVAG